MALETSCEQRCALAVATATSEIKAAEEKKEEFQASLFAAQADISTTNQLKLQVRYCHVMLGCIWLSTFGCFLHFALRYSAFCFCTVLNGVPYDIKIKDKMLPH